MIAKCVDPGPQKLLGLIRQHAHIVVSHFDVATSDFEGLRLAR